MVKKSKKNCKKAIVALAEFKTGDLVFGKLKGFPFWPATLGVNLGGKFRTNFFDYNKTW